MFSFFPFFGQKYPYTTLQKLYQWRKEHPNINIIFKIYFRVKHLIGFSEYFPPMKIPSYFQFVCLSVPDKYQCLLSFYYQLLSLSPHHPVLTLSQSLSDSLVGKISSVFYALWWEISPPLFIPPYWNLPLSLTS